MTAAPERNPTIKELQQTFDRLRADLDRVEILTCVLHEFTRPVPAYEPNLEHFSRVPLTAHETGRSG